MRNQGLQLKMNLSKGDMASVILNRKKVIRCLQHLAQPRLGWYSGCDLLLVIQKSLTDFLHGLTLEALVVGFLWLVKQSLNVSQDFLHLHGVHGIQALQNGQFG